MIEDNSNLSENHRKSITYVNPAQTYYDKVSDTRVIKVFAGDCYVTDRIGEMMVTVLGSCISVCIRDPIARVGGMNHFLLPDSVGAADAPMRYGAYSMEKLINDILKMGGRKQRLEIKVFGGGNVIESSAMIGDKNVKFIRDYLEAEGLKIAQQDVGGTSPRRIHYYPDSGRVMMRKINKKEEVASVEKEERTYSRKLAKSVEQEESGGAELF
jgi:chemotaxis protein CheD